MRARKPIIPPTSVSIAIIRKTTTGSSPSAAAGILSSSVGVSAMVTPSATNSRIWIGISLAEKPGASMRQPPMRQKSRNAPIARCGPSGGGASARLSADSAIIKASRAAHPGGRRLPGAGGRRRRLEASRLRLGTLDGAPAHEIVPSDLISKPRAISSCDSTGSVGNMRSTIMRT